MHGYLKDLHPLTIETLGQTKLSLMLFFSSSLILSEMCIMSGLVHFFCTAALCLHCNLHSGHPLRFTFCPIFVVYVKGTVEIHKFDQTKLTRVNCHRKVHGWSIVRVIFSRWIFSCMVDCFQIRSYMYLGGICGFSNWIFLKSYLPASKNYVISCSRYSPS